MSTRGIHLLSKLESAFSEKNWDAVSTLLDPKLFRTLPSQELIAFPILSKVAEIVTLENPEAPSDVKIACLKCLGNSCFNSYTHKEYISVEIEAGKYCHNLYSFLADNENFKRVEASNEYPFDSHFPYQGVIEWASNFIASKNVYETLSNEELEILRLSIQFLCNLFTFAYKDDNLPDEFNSPNSLKDSHMKRVIIDSTNSDQVSLARAACAFVHNILKEFEEEIFTPMEKIQLCSGLLKPIEKGLESAKDALMYLLYKTDILAEVYNDMSAKDRLFLLQIIYYELYNSSEEYVFTKATVEYLIERFCKRSDLILQTVDISVNELEATEIVLLLNILGVLTSNSLQKYDFLKGCKSLLINCVYLLKSIHTIGKQSDNCFTPLQRLSDLAPAMQRIANDKEKDTDDPKVPENQIEKNMGITVLSEHPAFGFKAGLIRIIGNMVYRNKECQDLLRETDAIPLLLDCCNIDARNPLIMQWTILGLRNLCEDNPRNQEIVRNCTRIGVVENSTLLEMGVTLQEDEEGKKIGIVPLPREEK